MAQFILFIDTNVFLDALLLREKGADCKKILNLAEEGIAMVYTSASCLLTMIYFLQKAGIPDKVVRKSVEDLLEFILLNPIDKKAFTAALPAEFSDLEDGIQYQAALQIRGIDYFITSNIKDFKKAIATLPVLTPKQFIDQLKYPFNVPNH